jgi:hypothetical protein
MQFALDLSILLLSSGLCNIIVVGISPSSILKTCPADLCLAVFIIILISDPLKNHAVLCVLPPRLIDIMRICITHIAYEM